MYEIVTADAVIFSDVTPLEEVKVMDPKLTMEDSAAGSLTFTLPPCNAYYDKISCLTTEVKVTEDGKEIWRGRVIADSMDFWKQKKIVCEGELAYLNDSIQPPAKYNINNTTIRTFLEALIANHNAQMTDDSKRFSVGQVTVTDGDSIDDDDAINRFTNYETTLACINDKLVSRLGGHIRVRHFGGVRYIDYLKDYIEVAEQEIRFGRNLLDFVRNKDATKWVSAIIPRGERLDKEEIEGLEAYVTAKSSTIIDSWHASGSIVVKDPDLVSSLGFICEVVDWDKVTDANNLVKKAKKYLQDLRTKELDKMVLELSAVDLHYFNPDIEALKLLEEIWCISEPHGFRERFPVTKIELDLINPSNTTYTLGTEVHGTLTSASSKLSNEVYNSIYGQGESSILRAAKENAKALIEGTADDGYAGMLFGTDANGVPIIDPTTGDKEHPSRPTGFFVMNNLTDETATHRWLWTYGGFGHQKKVGNAWQAPNVALTMEGAIVADFITTGTMQADRIKGGTLTLGGDGNGNGVMLVKNASGTVIGRWNKDGILAKNGEFHGNFVVAEGAGYIVDQIPNPTAQIYLKSGSIHLIASEPPGLFMRVSGQDKTYVCWGSTNCECKKSDGTTTGQVPSFDIIAAGNGASDRRLKNNIKSIDPEFAKDLILGITPSQFKFKSDPNTLHFGVIAQDILEIEKKHNITEANRLCYILNDKGMYGVEYRQLIAPMIKVIQLQQEQINTLIEEVKSLKGA